MKELPVKGLDLNGAILTTDEDNRLIYDGEVIRMAAQLTKVIAGEDILANRVCVIHNSVAYYASSTELTHASKPKFISLDTTFVGSTVTLQEDLKVVKAGWQLTRNSHYFVGPSGTLVIVPPTVGFVQRMGTAIDSDTLQLHVSESIKL